MEYICVKPYKGIPVGDRLNAVDGKIKRRGEFLCYVTSQSAYDHFSLNEDGLGNKRFELRREILGKVAEFALAHSEAVAEIMATDKTDEEKEALTASLTDKSLTALGSLEAKGFLTRKVPNRAFHEAPVPDLLSLKEEIFAL